MSENVVTVKPGSEVTQGHRKWYHSIDWVCFLLVFYIVTSSVRCTVFEISSDLETRVRGHSRSSKIIPLNPAPTTSY